MKENSELGFFDKAWSVSKIEFNSNILAKTKGSISVDNIDTLSNFVKKRGIETRGIDNDTKASDLLKKYTISKLTPERGEQENALEMYLISDEFGHDIGTYEITEKGPVFRISPKIQEYNEKIIATFPQEQQEMLREIYRIDSLEELTDRLAKGEKIALVSKEQARDDIENEYEARGLSRLDETTNEDPEEEKAISSIPADMRAEVIEQCRKRGISIKQVLIVDCPECLSEEIDNERVGIRKDAGPVILIQARSGDASLTDDVYMFQNGVEIPNANEQNERLVNLMEQHKGKGAVTELVDTKKEIVMKHIAEVIKNKQNQIEQLEMANFESEESREAAIMKLRADLVGEVKSVIDYHDYEPDEQMNNFVGDLEHEAAPDSMDTMDEIQEGIIEGTVAAMGAVGSALVGDDEYEKNRWDSANPYYHS